MRFQKEHRIGRKEEVKGNYLLIAKRMQSGK
jgi:hypothetical protein